MKCCIMQPTYLPWSGYFNLIASVDTFVFLDSVQFERQSWQSRNRILLHAVEHLLVVPVERAPLDTRICDVVTSERRGNWRVAHFKTLNSAYGKTLYGRELLDLLEPLYTQPAPVNLADFNISLITSLARALGLSAGFVRAASLEHQGERTQRLIAICKSLSADTYLSPLGSRSYLEDDGFTGASDVELELQSYMPTYYRQYKTEDFFSHLSIIDVIANIGLVNTSAYILEAT